MVPLVHVCPSVWVKLATAGNGTAIPVIFPVWGSAEAELPSPQFNSNETRSACDHPLPAATITGSTISCLLAIRGVL